MQDKRRHRPLTKEMIAKRLTEPNGPETLSKIPYDVFDGAFELYTEGSAAAGALLCRLARQKEFQDKLNRLFGQERKALRDGIASDSPKLRKNSARLAALLGNIEDAAYILNAFKAENTRFVRPSQILALGSLGDEISAKYLSSYIVPPAAEGEESHYAAETEALTLVKRRMRKLERHTFTRLPAPHEIVLRTADKLSGSAAYDLTQAGYHVSAQHQADIHVHTDDYAGLFISRCFQEALIEISNNSNPDPKAIAIKGRACLESLLPACHEGKPPYGFRVELRGEVDNRPAVAKSIASMMESDMLSNTPSSYDVEFRVEYRSNGSAALYLKLFTFKDDRFDYRIGSVPASMLPSTAAAILRYASLAIGKKDARVLDPCCGSGTFLIEREKMAPCASLTGIDIAHAAIDIARKNAEAANSSAKFIVNDCRRFEAERPYDELIANLPFGNRVGTHKDNIALYSDILDSLPRWLIKNGVAVLYSMEYTLLKKLIRERPNLKLLTEVRTDAGGLMPAVFIVKVS